MQEEKEGQVIEAPTEKEEILLVRLNILFNNGRPIQIELGNSVSQEEVQDLLGSIMAGNWTNGFDGERVSWSLNGKEVSYVTVDYDGEETND